MTTSSLMRNYSRGYKAGGFNLDRSALKSPILPFAASGGAQALSAGSSSTPKSSMHSNLAANIRRAV